MGKCLFPGCKDAAIGGFKHEVLAGHMQDPGAKAEDGWTCTVWCEDHESDLRRTLRGPGRLLTSSELQRLPA